MEEFFEALRSNFAFVYVLIFVPLTVLPPVVLAAQEFKAYRMQQFDLQGIPHGSRSHMVNFEARTLEAKNLLRKCVIARWEDISVSTLNDLVQRVVGAVLILLPAEFASNPGSIPAEELEKFAAFERQLLENSFAIPIFIVFESNEIRQVMEHLRLSTNSDNAATATQALVGSVAANGYQIVTLSSAQSKPLRNFNLVNVVGNLLPAQSPDSARTIVIVAHYDAFGLAPTLAFGSDSNASGAAALLELARIFSKLYGNSKTRPKFNIAFLLSGGGKLNFHGTRYWIDELSEHAESPLRNLDFAICLEGLDGDSLNFHVSRPPKEGSKMERIFNILQAQGRRQGANVSAVHKKINLAEEYFAWEHERFSFKKLPAFTISSFASPKNSLRYSILDKKKPDEMKNLAKNVRIVAESLIRYIYDFDGDAENLIENSLHVRESSLKSWLATFGRRPRSAQLFAEGAKDPMILALHGALDHWVHEAKIQIVPMDKKEPEFVMYDCQDEETMQAAIVKPAVFDLILAAAIVAYLGFIFLLVSQFRTIQAALLSVGKTFGGKKLKIG